MAHVVVKPEFAALLDPETPLKQLGAGFTFTEGPIWHPIEQFLLFSDMPADVRRRWDADAGVSEVRRPSNKCNGMTYDADLNLIVCEHATSRLMRERADGRREVLASHFEGKELNSPNDVCVRSDGSIYFTDPWYGRMPGFGVERPRELGFQGVYRVAPGGAGPELLVGRDLFEQPNGLCFSPDETHLYVNDTAGARIRIFDVAEDGSLSHSRVFAEGISSTAERGHADGMKCDAQRKCLGDRAGRPMGLFARGRTHRQGARSRSRRQSRLGRRGFPHAVPHREYVGLCAGYEGRPARRAVHEGRAFLTASLPRQHQSPGGFLYH